MKILLVSKHFWPENFRINEIIRKLSIKNSIQVISEVPSYQKRFDNLKKKINKNITIERVKSYPRGKTLFSIFFNYISFCIMSSFKVLREEKTDLVFVYATSPVFQAIPAIYGKIKKVPVCI